MRGPSKTIRNGVGSIGNRRFATNVDRGRRVMVMASSRSVEARYVVVEIMRMNIILESRTERESLPR